VSTDRRAAERIPVDFWVDERTDDAMYLQHATNLSLTGLYLDHTLPHEPGTRVVLDVRLPDDGPTIRVLAEVVSQDRELGMGLRFLDLTPAAAARVETFLNRERERSSERPPPNA